jgi:hypothetical protein
LIVFAYIEMMLSQPPLEWVFRELESVYQAF